MPHDDKKLLAYRQAHFNRLFLDLSNALAALEHLIMDTPTGPIRDSLTDANIHIMAAQDTLKNLYKGV